MSYEPHTLQRWTLPDCYMGANWPNHYSAGIGQNRDSSALDRSNFAAMLTALGGESDIVTVVRESHWAVGWVEWIAIEADGSAESDTALQIADELAASLEDYPVLDENAWSELEWEEAACHWDRLSPRDRVQWAMEIRKRYHWLQRAPVWIYGRMDYGALANHESDIAQSLCDALRE